MIQEIFDRRSIRRYKPDAVPKDMIEEIIRSGMAAPSSKNRQPWRFIIASGKAKDDALFAMQQGLEREKKEPLLPDSSDYLGGAEHTLRIMQQAPVVIFVVNPLGLDLKRCLNAEERIYELCNAQSVGAAIENMTLTATHLGLGSLWICDTYFAYRELAEWLHTDGELLAALAVGYADEAPTERPRKNIDDITEWQS